jgi:hypothetical protein
LKLSSLEEWSTTRIGMGMDTLRSTPSLAANLIMIVAVSRLS